MSTLTDREIREQVTDLSKSWVMTSGAGCGKTFQMVQRYVAIIASDVDVQRIIAVTFTEKAAAELKSRVRERCREMIAEADESDRKRWEQAARQLALAPVTTIHGLCGRLLRENAIEAGVDPQFGQLDEGEQGFLLAEVTRETLLARLHAGEETARRLVGRWELATTCEVLSGLVDEREDYAPILSAPPQAQELLRRWKAAAAEALEATLEQALSDERLTGAMAVLGSVDSPPADDKAGERILNLLEAMEIASDTGRGTQERVDALLAALAPITRASCGAKGNWSDRPEVLEEVRAAFVVLAGVKEDYRASFGALDNLEDEGAAEFSAAIAEEAAQIAAAYEREKQRHSLLDFADLQIMARDLLRDHPDVLERVQRRYEHVLVDEFQDTNALQKEIIWLIAGGDAQSGAPPPDGSLFVVGDAKQSIYGFRSADVTVFNETIQQFENGGSNCDVLHLTRTRRSTPGLVGLFNDLFSHEAVMGCAVQHDYEAPYEPVEAWREDHEKPLDAELILIDKDQLAQDDEETVSTHEARMREAEVLARRLSDIVESGEYTVRDEAGGQLRPARYGDIGILFRAMTNVGIYEYALRNAGVPFYTVAGQGFYARQEIRDCLSLLQSLENTSDEIALVGALRSPMFGLCDETIFWLTRSSGRLMDALRQVAAGEHPAQENIRGEQLPRVRRACRIIDRLRAIKDRVALSELVERMLSDTGLEALHLTQFAGRQALANLGKLTDLARGFEAGGEFSLRAFISYLTDLVVEEHREGLAEVHEEAADVVKLLTVHKAKGLQWPIVVVPDIGRSPRSSGGTVLVDPELGPLAKLEDREGAQKWGAIAEIIRAGQGDRDTAESRRLLYVAFTRARDMLLISGTLAFKKDGGLSGGPWLQWVLEALGFDTDPASDGDMLGAGRWRCRVGRPEAAQGERTRRRIGVERAALSLLDEALDAADRGAPEPLPLAVRPISPETCLPGRFSVTALEHYRRCPRLYYLRHVESLPEAHQGGDWLHGLSGIERGNVVHHALEIIGRRGTEPGAIDEAVESATAQGAVAPRITADEREDLTRAIAWIVREAELAPGRSLYREWVAEAARLRSEVQFMVPLAGARLEGYIDALAEDTCGDLRLLDYKTGQLNEARRDRYRFQLGLYCAAVREITGIAPAGAALVMPDSREVLLLDPHDAAAGALETARKIVEAIAGRSFDAAADRSPAGSDCARCPLAYACQVA